jgi:hypothetical protein
MRSHKATPIRVAPNRFDIAGSCCRASSVSSARSIRNRTKFWCKTNRRMLTAIKIAGAERIATSNSNTRSRCWSRNGSTSLEGWFLIENLDLRQSRGTANAPQAIMFPAILPRHHLSAPCQLALVKCRFGLPDASATPRHNPERRSSMRNGMHPMDTFGCIWSGRFLLAIGFNPRGPNKLAHQKRRPCRCLSGRARPDDRFLEGAMDGVEQFARAISKRLSKCVGAERIKQGRSEEAKVGRSCWRVSSPE